jgi:thioester reductase-like protein
MYVSPYDWEALYRLVIEMPVNDVSHYQKNIIGTFPNTYCFSKRMAEHLLVERNKKNIPLCIIRPTIIGATLSEPFPGWTDSIGLVSGLILIAGLGILRELPGNLNNIGDLIPVDIVVNQILASIPAAIRQQREE